MINRIATGLAQGLTLGLVMCLSLGLAGVFGLSGPASAEVMRSENLEADLTRRDVAMTSREGASFGAEQVYVTLRRRDGRPIGAEDMEGFVGFAEVAACKGRKVLVSLLVSATNGEGNYEVLCAKGQ